MDEATGTMRMYPSANVVRMEPRDPDLPYQRPPTEEEAMEIERKRQYMNR